jgi:hypothetical protein
MMWKKTIMTLANPVENANKEWNGIRRIPGYTRGGIRCLGEGGSLVNFHGNFGTFSN